MFSYNCSIHEATKFTPYELVFGKLARLPSSKPLAENENLPTYSGFLKEIVTRIINNQKSAYNNLIEAKLKSKKYYDRDCRPNLYKIGDSVFLRSGPKPGKLQDHYSGPFEILDITDSNGVIIKIKNKLKTVHPDRLKKTKIQHD